MDFGDIHEYEYVILRLERPLSLHIHSCVFLKPLPTFHTRMNGLFSAILGNTWNNRHKFFWN